MAWNSAFRASLQEPKAESPSTINTSRCSTSFERQSTNLSTLSSIEFEDCSVFLRFMRSLSLRSRLRLFTSTWSAILSASALFSIKYTSSWCLRKSVIASYINLLVIAFLVWFSYEVTVENEEITSTRHSSISEKVILLSFDLYLPLCFIYASICETKALRVAFSGTPPYSSQLELW